MSFDKLPDELLVKIFSHLSDDRRNYANLAKTCRRLHGIVNTKLVTPNLFHEQYPVLYVNETKPTFEQNGYRKHPRVDLTPEALDNMMKSCKECDKIRQKAQVRLINFRCVKFAGMPQPCCIKTIIERQSKLGTIVELQFDTDVRWTEVDTFLHEIGTIKRLSVAGAFPDSWTNCIFEDDYYERRNFIDKVKRRNIPGLTLSCLSLKNPYYDKFLEIYTILNVPAHQVEFCETVLREELYGSYLKKHRSIVRRCTIPDGCILIERVHRSLIRLGFELDCVENRESQKSGPVRVYSSSCTTASNDPLPNRIPDDDALRTVWMLRAIKEGMSLSDIAGASRRPFMG